MAGNEHTGARRTVYVIDGSRTPFLKARGVPGPFTSGDLAVGCGRPLLMRQPFEPGHLDEVVLGCVMPGPNEANVARVAGLRLGVSERTPGYTVQRNCGSGMQALDDGAEAIAAGRADLVLAGGTEAMSHAPLIWSTAFVTWLGEWRMAKGAGRRARLLARLRPRDLKPIVALLRGLTDPVVGLSMGQTAENLAYRFAISREAMDRFAEASHQRLANALDAGYLGEIEPQFDHEGGIHDHDDGLRPDTDAAGLAALKPAFDKPFGDVTAGNSAQVTDGAAWLILASETAVKRHGLTPIGRIVDSQWAGLAPADMGLGPVHATTPMMARRRLGARDVDYWEINEAFAAQVLACLTAWRDARYCRNVLGRRRPLGEIPHEQLNVDGGAISLGHPVGASGARIVLHLLKVLERTGSRRGIATLCIGGGQGGAMLLERD